MNDKLKLINMRWNAYYYSCNQVPCKGCNLGLDLLETLAFFLLDAVLDAVRRRLPLDCELCEELDLSDRGLFWANDREVWGVTCSAGTAGGVGSAKIERRPSREEEGAVGMTTGLSGGEWDREERREG